MQLLTILLCLLISLILIEAAKVDKLNKKSKDVKARSNVKKMLRNLGRGRQKVKDAKGNGLRRKKEMKDKNGNKFVRIEQEYDDLRVFGFEMIERENKGGRIAELDKSTGKPTGRMIKIKKEKKLHGKFANGLRKDLGKINKSKLNPRRALKKLKDRNKGKKISKEHAESVIFVNENTGQSQVAYEVNIVIEGSDQPSIPSALYDQHGDIIMEWDNIQHQSIVQRGTGPGGNDKMGKHQYGRSKPLLHVKDMNNGKCQYETDNIKVVDMDHSRDYSTFNEVFEYNCYNQESDEVNGAYSALNDANHFGNVVFNMYNKWYSTNPLKTLPMTFKVHFGTGYENAFYSPSGGYMVFGDGQNYFHPLVSLDVVAHEVSHGVTHETSGLIYSGQSGGLNEAFSDMAGKAAERFSRGYNAQTFNWGIGNDIVKSSTGQLRCMDNPTCDWWSIDNVNQYYNDINVHASSGIFNKVFYLLSTKFPYDLWDAFDLFYVANTKFWQPSTTFVEAAELTLEAMEEMKEGKHLPYKYGWIKMSNIVDAFSQVGIRCTQSGTDWNCV